MCVFVVDTFHYAEKVYILGVVTSSPTAFTEGTVKEAWVTEKLQQSTVPFHGTYCAVRGQHAGLACCLSLVSQSALTAAGKSF